MGLDMYLFKRGKTAKMKIVMALDGKSEHIELAYWRKSYELHEKFLSYAKIDFVTKLFEQGNDLNCQAIPLSKDDLINILEWLKDLDSNDEYSEEVLKRALKETDFDNEEIYYYAWW